LATHPSAEKRDRQNKKHKIRNAAVKSKTKTEIKKVLAAVEELDKDSSERALKSAITVIQRRLSQKQCFPQSFTPDQKGQRPQKGLVKDNKRPCAFDMCARAFLCLPYIHQTRANV
jgi:small subunit ribosomal protein S20